MNIGEAIKKLEQFAPLHLQESYDNSGLLVGDKSQKITGVLVCLDSTEDVIQEAIDKNCNLVVAHHPIIFSGLKRLTGENYIQRTVIKAIKNDIAIYACHTNLDNISEGVNLKIAQKIGLQNPKILSPKKGLYKLEMTLSSTQLEGVTNILNKYSEAFHLEDHYHTISNVGAGSSSAGNSAIISISKKFTPAHKSIMATVIHQLETKHQVVCTVSDIDGSDKTIGSGMIGTLPKPLKTTDFLKHLKKTMKLSTIKYTQVTSDEIKKVAICGGAGGFLLQRAISSGADIFITSDFKYHEFFDADNRIIIADIGHYESEQFTTELFHDFLNEKFNTFAVHYSETKTNPVNYL